MKLPRVKGSAATAALDYLGSSAEGIQKCHEFFPYKYIINYYYIL